MKKVILFSLLLIGFLPSFGQKTNPSVALTKEIYPRKSKEDLLIKSSIPLFVAAGKNKKKGIAGSASFKIEKTQQVRRLGLSQRKFPALSLRINF